MKAKCEELLAANTAIPRLRKDVEALVQEASSLRQKQQEASAKGMQAYLEQDQVRLLRLLRGFTQVHYGLEINKKQVFFVCSGLFSWLDSEQGN